MKIVLLSLAGFLIGSVPTGQIIARSRGIDLQQTGSGNIGATNVLRTSGKLPALITLVGDMVKGMAAVLMARYFDAGIWYEGVVGILAVLGHNFSIFLKFKGGKGVATSLGVLVMYAPLAALATMGVWLAAVLMTRYSSLGAILSCCALPLAVYLFDDREKLLISLLLSIIVLMRHKDNIRRLIRGTETKVGNKT